MTIHHLIFQPTLSGNYGSFDKIPLDHQTPRGIFLGAKWNRYLVCESPFSRFAVALRHEEFEPFRSFELGELPADTGTHWGVGCFHLGEPIRVFPDDLAPGFLEVSQDFIRLLVRDWTGGTHWQIVAHGTGGAEAYYRDWSLMEDNDTPVFSSDGVY